MTFTKIGNGLAWVIFGLAIFRIVTVLALTLSGNESESIARYLGCSRSTGQIIDQAFLWLVIAVALGILVNICNAVTPKKTNEGE